MKTSTAKDIEYPFDRLTELAQAEPVAIVKRGRSVVALAVEEYDRLTEASRTGDDPHRSLER